jgi:hypothetical protein
MVAIAAVLLGATLGWWSGVVRGCEPIAPSVLPSGAAPGDGTVDVAGGTKQVIWGDGQDRVDQRVGLSFYGGSGDRVLFNVAVRGNPAIVYSTDPEFGEILALSWTEAGCDRTLLFDASMDAEEIARYAARY